LYWFERTSALDRFAVVDDDVCFDDLTLAYDLAPVAAETTYVIETFDRDARAIASRFVLHPGAGGRTCFPMRLAPSHDGYTIVKLTTARRDHAHAIYVHLARDQSGAPRVIGIWRP
jgi:hypothetical protein